MIQVTRAALVCTAGDAAIDAARREFERTHALHLPHFIGADLLDLVRDAMRHTRFADRDDAGIAREATMDPHPAIAALLLVFNDPLLLALLTRLTGCAPLESFVGRIYRMHAAAGHYDRWHSDASDDRRLGISVNLSAGRFAGGSLEIRPAGGSAPSWTFANTGVGDAVLFRISDALEHRVTAVEGHVARVAFAGWFLASSPLIEVLRTRTAANA